MDFLSDEEQLRLRSLQITNLQAADTVQQLRRILASRTFHRVQQNARCFLEYVVAQKLLGHEDRIKETTIAVRVYGEGPRNSGRVRVAAVALRKRLAQYYDVEGLSDPLEIRLPDGTYVPAILDRRPWIVLAPFENWNPDNDQSHLASLLAQEINYQLRRQHMRVSEPCKTAERGEAPRYVVRGCFGCIGDRLRLTVGIADHCSGILVATGHLDELRDDFMRLAGHTVEFISAAILPNRRRSREP